MYTLLIPINHASLSLSLLASRHTYISFSKNEVVRDEDQRRDLSHFKSLEPWNDAAVTIFVSEILCSPNKSIHDSPDESEDMKTMQ